MFFLLFSTTKVKIVDEMIQNDYLCYFTCQAQKNYWGPPTAPPPKRISAEGKIVSKYCNIPITVGV